MQELKDSHYTPAADRSHAFDLYVTPHVGAEIKPPLICFVHGGAWRSEDKQDHAELARLLCARTHCSVAVPNYRLTRPETPLRHPGHSEDILAFLEYLRDFRTPSGEQPYDRDHIFLMGHSCSAHMLASILLESPYPSIKPSLGILRAVRAVVLSEGIYDIDLLLKSFPSYHEWFIAPAFGDRDTFGDDAVSGYPCRQEGEHIRWLIIHSTGDTLVDVLQSQAMYKHLLSTERASGGTSPTRVHTDFEKLNTEHNDTLKSDAFVDIVADFLSR